MIAADTNVIVRLIVSDDDAQREAAEARLPEGFFVSHGVLMEVEWVLRSTYRLPRNQINDALRNLIYLEEIGIPHLPFVLWALDRHADGADLADMLHLISARGASVFLTFDRELADWGKVGAPIEVELLQ